MSDPHLVYIFREFAVQFVRPRLVCASPQVPSSAAQPKPKKFRIVSGSISFHIIDRNGLRIIYHDKE